MDGRVTNARGVFDGADNFLGCWECFWCWEHWIFRGRKGDVPPAAVVSVLVGDRTI
jgi:hypothetical protein